MARKLKTFLAMQIRALRGDMRQSEFGEKIGKPQSVVSRLEKQLDKQVSVQTLIDIAASLDVAVLIKFVDYNTFLRETEDMSEGALVPAAYSEVSVRASVPGPKPTLVKDFGSDLSAEDRSFRQRVRAEAEFASVN